MNNSIIPFEFLPVGSMSNENPEFIQIGAPYFTILERMGGKQITDTLTSTSISLVFFILTGGTEQKVLTHLEQKKLGSEQPLIILTHPGNNSLPASLEILARWQQEGNHGTIIYLSDPTDTNGLHILSEHLFLINAHTIMLSSTIGLVGKPSDWLVASMPEHKTITEVWGPKVVDIDFGHYFKKVEKADSSKNLKPLSKFITNAKTITGPQQDDFKKSVDVYTALQEVIAENNLNALSVRCFDLVTCHQSTGCYALSQLNDDHIVSGCEGDLVSTVGMLWAKALLQSPSWMANPARIDKQNNTLWLAHCTIATGMTNQYELLSHFETDLGIGIRGHVSPQPCTIFRLGGKSMNQLWITEGQITHSGTEANLCRTQLEIVLNNPEALDNLLERPLGNHMVLVYGHHKKTLTLFHDLFIKSKS